MGEGLWLAARIDQTGSTSSGPSFTCRKEENILFNDALNTFYLQLYGIRPMLKDH